MKKYIIKLTAFVSIAAAITACIIAYKQTAYPRYDYKLPEGKHILFVGASLLETAIDDSKMEEAINLCHSAEPHMFTYLKLKYILRDNKEVDTVFIGMGPAGLYRDTDLRYFSDQTAPYFIGNFYPLLAREEWRILMERDPAMIFRNMSYSLDEKIYTSGKRYMQGTGGFQRVHKRLDRDKDFVKEEYTGSYGNEINIKYLHKINDLCRENGIKLYCLFSPRRRGNDVYEEEKFYETYERHFSDIELVDYSDWEIADSLRQDSHHLNYQGAQLFTEEIKNRFRLK